ncbi:Occludin, partial [Cuculus canorus]
PTTYGPAMGDYGYDYGARSPPPGSYYIEDVPQHFYKWTSPPGVVRILEAIVVLLCIAIFACVASTLAWEYGYGFAGGYGNGLGGYYGSRLAVLCFLAQLGLFVTSISKSRSSRSRRFYLVVIVVCAMLAFVMLIASIVYVVGVNPQAQMSGSYYYNPLLTMCSQVYSGGTYISQYIYHYCTVDPQEAVAIVCGFLIVILLCLICFFAHKTRSKIWKYGKQNIYWDKVPVVQEGPNVEEWVSLGGSSPSCPFPVGLSGWDVLAQGPRGTGAVPSLCHSPFPPWPRLCARSRVLPGLCRPGARLGVSASSSTRLPGRGVIATGAMPYPALAGRRRNPELDESQYETDYTTAVESSDERDQDQWASPYPPITSDGTRQKYKQEFDVDLKRYKQLCAEMDGISDRLNQLSKQLDSISEDSPQYQDVAEEYNRLKDLKRSPGYQTKKAETKTLRNKLFHIKRMVSD